MIYSLRNLIKPALLICLLCFSCSPEQANDKYIGTYTTTYVQNCWGALPPCYSTGQEDITVSSGNTSNAVIIKGYEVTINSDGTGSLGGGSSFGFNVTFRNDSIFMSEHSGGLGGGTSRSNIGKRN